VDQAALDQVELPLQVNKQVQQATLLLLLLVKVTLVVMDLIMAAVVVAVVLVQPVPQLVATTAQMVVQEQPTVTLDHLLLTRAAAADHLNLMQALKGLDKQTAVMVLIHQPLQQMLLLTLALAAVVRTHSHQQVQAAQAVQEL
jgi:hypothetical protein